MTIAPQEPVEIELGEAFEFGGIGFAKGWSLGDEGMARGTVVDLEVAQPHEDGDGEVMRLVFRKGEKEVG